MESILSARKLTYRYDSRKPDGVLDIDFELKTGQILALLGPSGSGKTTLLKLLSGELTPQSGKIERKPNLKLGFVKQRVEHLDCETVYDFLFKSLNSIDEEIKRENQIRSVLSQLDLTNEIHSTLDCLSGGQLQRVSIAAALAKNPQILFFDEPFANLDWSLKEDLLQEVLPIIKERGISVIWTTHHYQEVFPHADEILLINSGEIQAKATPQDLYFKPQNIFTALYFGKNNVLPGSFFQEKAELVVLRPCDIEVSLKPLPNYIQGLVLKSENYGAYSLWKVQVKDQELWVQVQPHLTAESIVYLNWDSRKLHLLG